MELQENNILKQKLYHLDQLPDGYTPSLDSKFELLMTGTAPAATTRINRLRYLIPAAVAACITVVIFLFSSTPSAMQYAAQYYSGRQLAPPAASTPAIAVRENSATPANKYVAPRTALPQRQTVSAHNTVIEPEPVIAVATDAPQTTQPETPAVSHSMEAQLSASVSTKEKKARFTEIDFDDVPYTTPEMNAGTVHHPKLGFKINFLHSAAGNASAKSPLRFKQNF
jgi:hypothetical protein